MKRAQGPIRKRPHILPPLTMIQGSVSSPVDPLQPPTIVTIEPRFGSPTPRWHRPAAEDPDFFQGISEDGKPSIRVTFYDQEGNPADGTDRRSSLNSDLRSDPYFKEEDSVIKGKRRGSIKNVVSEEIKTDQIFNDRSAKRNTDEQRYQSTWSPKGILQMNPCKVRQLPNRYAPLKPISKQLNTIKKEEQ